jgi:hypothetical protein
VRSITEMREEGEGRREEGGGRREIDTQYITCQQD